MRLPGFQSTEAVGLAMLAACTNINGGSATLDTNLICTEMGPVDEMVQANIISGDPSFAAHWSLSSIGKISVSVGSSSTFLPQRRNHSAEELAPHYCKMSTKNQDGKVVCRVVH